MRSSFLPRVFAALETSMLILPSPFTDNISKCMNVIQCAVSLFQLFPHRILVQLNESRAATIDQFLCELYGTNPFWRIGELEFLTDALKLIDEHLMIERAVMRNDAV